MISDEEYQRLRVLLRRRSWPLRLLIYLAKILIAGALLFLFFHLVHRSQAL